MPSSMRRVSSSSLFLSVVVLAAGCSSSAVAPPFQLGGLDVVGVDGVARASDGTGPRLLVVTAHPDDEIAFTGVVYKTVTHLDGVADLCVITDGQGGFKYASLAEPIHGQELTDEPVGRRELPAIRRAELERGAAWMGFRAIVYLDELDHRYTQDVDEVLGETAEVWDLGSVRDALDRLLAHGAYDAVLLFTPDPATHAHHKAASLLALEAVARMPLDRRPAVLAVDTESDGEAADEPFRSLEGWPLSVVRGEPRLVFDRRQPFGFRDRLDYGIVANWAIAEHKSQGTMQLLMGRVDREVYRPFELSPLARDAELRAWFERLAEPQYPARTYGESAGTNASAGSGGTR